MLQRETFTVYLNPTDDSEPTEHTVTITHQDMLRGEQENLRAGSSDRAALALTTSWVWAALMRTGQYSGAYTMFRDTACAGIEKGEPADVDPTTPATTDSFVSS